MSTAISPDTVKAFVIDFVAEELAAVNVAPDDVTDDYDLLATGTIDSLGLLELVGAIEDFVGVRISFEELDPEDLGVIGPFSQYIATRVRREEGTG